MRDETRQIATRFEEIRQRSETGRLTAEAVVQDATPADSLLHPYFTWDDAVAGHKFRLEEARVLIGRVRYEVTIEDRVYSIPRYIRDPDAPAWEQGYTTIVSLHDTRDKAVRALQYELERAESIVQRVIGLAGALGLDNRVEPILGQIKDLQKTVAIGVAR